MTGIQPDEQSIAEFGMPVTGGHESSIATSRLCHCYAN